MSLPQNPTQEPDFNQCQGSYEFSNFLPLREATEEKLLFLEAVIIFYIGLKSQAKILQILRENMLPGASPVPHTLGGHSFKRSCSCTLQVCAHTFIITQMWQQQRCWKSWLFPLIMKQLHLGWWDVQSTLSACWHRLFN